MHQVGRNETPIGLEPDLTEPAAKVLGTTTKKDTVPAALAAAVAEAERQARRREHWEREKALAGGFDAIIANGNGDRKAHTKVTIRAKDKGFTSEGCATRTKEQGRAGRAA
jgi:hypothetical protein